MQAVGLKGLLYYSRESICGEWGLGSQYRQPLMLTPVDVLGFVAVLGLTAVLWKDCLKGWPSVGL